MTSVSPSSTWSLGKLLETIEELHDPQTESWFLMNPTHIFTILVSYLIFSLYLGPKLMRNRPPMDLKYVMIAYNVIQMITNIYFVQMVITFYVLPGHFDIFCERLDKNNKPLITMALTNFHLFFLSRIFDFCDTVFIILKKKNTQLSFLHIYHHFTMGFFTWLGLYTRMGEHFIFFGMLNSTVHSVMYFYYSLMLVSPKYKKSIWWKKHITHLQLIQFCILLVQYAGTIINPSCSKPIQIGCMIAFPLCLSITLLFTNFYYHAYVKPKPAIEANKNK